MLAAAALVLAGLPGWSARLGSVLRAVRDHEERTAYFGYDVAACKRFAFTVSGGVAGLAGALFVTQFGFVSPALIGFSLSTEVLIWTALGGREVLLAAWLAAILVRTVEGTLSEALGHYWLLALGVMFVVAVVFLPRGLLGWLLRLLVSPGAWSWWSQPQARRCRTSSLYGLIESAHAVLKHEQRVDDSPRRRMSQAPGRCRGPRRTRPFRAAEDRLRP